MDDAAKLISFYLIFIIAAVLFVTIYGNENGCIRAGLIEYRVNVELVSQKDSSVVFAHKAIYKDDRIEIYDENGNWIADYGQCYYYTRKPKGDKRDD